MERPEKPTADVLKQIAPRIGLAQPCLLLEVWDKWTPGEPPGPSVVIGGYPDTAEVLAMIEVHARTVLRCEERRRHHAVILRYDGKSFESIFELSKEEADAGTEELPPTAQVDLLSILYVYACVGLQYHREAIYKDTPVALAAVEAHVDQFLAENKSETFVAMAVRMCGGLGEMVLAKGSAAHAKAEAEAKAQAKEKAVITAEGETQILPFAPRQSRN